MKLQQMSRKGKPSQFFICLPNQLVRAKGWQKGDLIRATIDKQGDIILKKVEE